MNIKLGNKIIKFETWKLVDEKNINNINRIKLINNSLSFGGALLMQSYSDVYDSDFWTVMFLGPELNFMNKIYDELSHPKFKLEKYEAAQDYVDNFMIKISKLLIFI